MLSFLTRALVIYIVVIVAMRLMGKRQLAELQPSELVTTFLISNVASICIEEPELPILSSLVTILLISALEILNSTLAWYLPGYARLLFGKPVTVIRNGQIQESGLRHLRITPNDLAESLRGMEIFSPEEVLWGVVESNGTLSVARTPPGRAGAAAFAHPDRPAPVQRQPAGAAPGRDLAGTDAGQKGAYPQPGAGIAGKRPAHPAGRQKAGGNRRMSRPGKANARRKTRFRRAAQKGSEVF